MTSGIFSTGRPLIKAKTAAYTLTPDDECVQFTTRGASGTVTFTLPPIASVPNGWSARFYNVVGQTMAITAPANKLTTFNNATATTATFSTSSELIGAAAEVVFDGSTYLLHLMTEETQTVTIS